MKLYKKVIICFILMLISIILSSKTVYGVVPADILGKKLSGFSGYIGQQVITSQWVPSRCTQHYAQGWDYTITGIYSVYYDENEGKIKLDARSRDYRFNIKL